MHNNPLTKLNFEDIKALEFIVTYSVRNSLSNETFDHTYRYNIDLSGAPLGSIKDLSVNLKRFVDSSLAFPIEIAVRPIYKSGLLCTVPYDIPSKYWTDLNRAGIIIDLSSTIVKPVKITYAPDFDKPSAIKVVLASKINNGAITQYSDIYDITTNCIQSIDGQHIDSIGHLSVSDRAMEILVSHKDSTNIYYALSHNDKWSIFTANIAGLHFYEMECGKKLMKVTLDNDRECDDPKIKGVLRLDHN